MAFIKLQMLSLFCLSKKALFSFLLVYLSTFLELLLSRIAYREWAHILWVVSGGSLDMMMSIIRRKF